jgi:hypothetical protein
MIVNLTTRPLVLVGKDGTSITIRPSGRIAQVITSEIDVDRIEIGWLVIPVIRTVVGQVIDLPEPDGKTKYLVRREVQAACPDRNDLLVPTRFLHDETGVTSNEARALSAGSF